MKLVHTIKELQSELDALRNIGKTIGLVPTMGALHAGHASLVKRAVAENDVVVVSDFVNPTQFNDRNDLIKYPRTLDADCELLEKVGASLFCSIRGRNLSGAGYTPVQLCSVGHSNGRTIPSGTF